MKREEGKQESAKEEEEEVKTIMMDSKLYLEDKEEVYLEGELYRKITNTKLKKYWFTLLGKELYCYRRKEDDVHKKMYNL
jgi:hypothetical protein